MSDTQDNEVVVLVEFDDAGELRSVANEDDEARLAALSGKSKEAVEKTLATIAWVAERTKTFLADAHESPDEVELEFGVAIGAKAGVLVMHADSEFHIKAKLTWKKRND